MPTTNPSDFTPQFWWNVIQGATTVGIAYLVYRLNKRVAKNSERVAEQTRIHSEHKLRLELFEKRYAVYAEVRRFIDAALSSPGPVPEDFTSVRTNIAEAYFLFGEDVNQFLSVLDLNTNALEIARIEYGLLGESDDKEAGQKKLMTVVRQFSESLNGWTKLFMPYLDFRGLRLEQRSDSEVDRVK